MPLEVKSFYEQGARHSAKVVVARGRFKARWVGRLSGMRIDADVDFIDSFGKAYESPTRMDSVHVPGIAKHGLERSGWNLQACASSAKRECLRIFVDFYGGYFEDSVR